MKEKARTRRQFFLVWFPCVGFGCSHLRSFPVKITYRGLFSGGVISMVSPTSGFFWCWTWSPGSLACQEHAMPLSYTLEHALSTFHFYQGIQQKTRSHGERLCRGTNYYNYQAAVKGLLPCTQIQAP